MKKAYWVVAYRSIADEAAVKAYGELAIPALQWLCGKGQVLWSLRFGCGGGFVLQGVIEPP